MYGEGRLGFGRVLGLRLFMENPAQIFRCHNSKDSGKEGDSIMRSPKVDPNVP